MASIVSTVEIGCSPTEVFSYVTDPSRFAEWQKNVVNGHVEGNHPVGVGSRCITTRRIGGADRTTTSEITQFSPPKSWTVHGVDGPIRANVNVTVEPLNENEQSRVTIDLAFEGHGIGKLLVPLVIRQARKEAPRSCRNLKDRLEERGA